VKLTKIVDSYKFSMGVFLVAIVVLCVLAVIGLVLYFKMKGNDDLTWDHNTICFSAAEHSCQKDACASKYMWPATMKVKDIETSYCCLKPLLAPTLTNCDEAPGPKSGDSSRSCEAIQIGGDANKKYCCEVDAVNMMSSQPSGDNSTPTTSPFMLWNRATTCKVSAECVDQEWPMKATLPANDEKQYCCAYPSAATLTCEKTSDTECAEGENSVIAKGVTYCCSSPSS